MSDDQFQKLLTNIQEQFQLLRRDFQTRVDHLAGLLNQVIKDQETADHEHRAIVRELESYSSWINSATKQLDIDYH